MEAEEKAVVSGGDGEIAVDGGVVSQRSSTLQGGRPRLWLKPTSAERVLVRTNKTNMAMPGLLFHNFS